MENRTESNITDIIKFYEILKKDVHALLFKRSKSSAHYEGLLYLYEEEDDVEEDVSLTYPWYILRTIGLNGILKIDNCWWSILEDMIKTDIMIWGRTSFISNISLVREEPPLKEITFSLSYR